MAVYLRTKALFVSSEIIEDPTIEVALVHISGDSVLSAVNNSDRDGFIELLYHNNNVATIKSTMAEFDKKLRELGHEIIQ